MIDEATLQRWADNAREAAHMTCEPWRGRLLKDEAEMRAKIEVLRANLRPEQRNQQVE